MKTKALVAVRSGSVRVKNKNIRPFAGSTLLERKLEQLKRISCLDGVIVNSNDDMMLDMARALGCETVKRDPYYASNQVSMSDVYANMAEQCDSDIIVYANVTNPLLLDETIHRAVETFHANRRQYDSVNSAHLIKEFLFLNNEPINYDLMHQPRSQDLPDIAALNFAVNVLPRHVMINCKNIVGTKPCIFLIDEVEATDIDNPIDFAFAEFVVMNQMDTPK